MSDKGSPPRDIDNLATNPLSPSASLLSPEESPDRSTTNNLTGDTYNLGTDVLSPGNFSIDEEDDDDDDSNDNDSPPSRQLSTDDGSVSSRKSKKGESSAKLMKLSNKTTKIMSDYQAYLSKFIYVCYVYLFVREKRGEAICISFLYVLLQYVQLDILLY